ncbi:hypothetical protein QYF36_004481 [Acer negundo]|nr:hypothetical protein QYF36_004481 [Acer negundo]
MATATDTPSHFFKIILPKTLEDKNLRIPEKFARKFGDELSDVAMLRVPNGHKSVHQHEIKREESVETMEDLRTPNPPSSSLKKKDFRSCSKICLKPPSKQNQAKPSFRSAPVTKRGRKCAAASLKSTPTEEYGMETRMMKKCKREKLMEINESNLAAGNEYNLT